MDLLEGNEGNTKKDCAQEIAEKLEACSVSESDETERAPSSRRTRKTCSGGRQRHSSSASSTSCSDTGYKDIWKSPSKNIYTSNFKKEALEEIKIFYENEPKPIKDFFEMIKAKKEWQIIPKVQKSLDIIKGMTEKQLGTFCIDLETITKIAAKVYDDQSQNNEENLMEFKSLKREVYHVIASSADLIDAYFEETMGSGKYTDILLIRLFRHWTSAVLEFLQSCTDVVQTIAHPQVFPNLSADQKPKEKKTCEIVFHTLFMTFSKIFFLHPRQHRKTYGIFRKKVVSSEPDVCYLQTLGPSGNDEPVLVMMCEVKRVKLSESKRKYKEKWIEKQMNSDNMGQIGAELLSESSRSFFYPNVLGIACLRTEIMFLFLDITREHFQAIVKDEPLDGQKARIHYTKTYDILKPTDRAEFMDIMLYLAAIQRNNFNRPI